MEFQIRALTMSSNPFRWPSDNTAGHLSKASRPDTLRVMHTARSMPVGSLHSSGYLAPNHFLDSRYPTENRRWCKCLSPLQ